MKKLMLVLSALFFMLAVAIGIEQVFSHGVFWEWDDVHHELFMFAGLSLSFVLLSLSWMMSSRRWNRV